MDWQGCATFSVRRGSTINLLMDVAAIRRVGVIGAGQMGRGIAQVSASVGLEVKLVDSTRALAGAAKDQIAGALRKLVDKGQLGAADRNDVLDRIVPAEGTTAVEGCDLVIEAATEEVEAKLQIFREADLALGPDAILASNTSSISITRLASVTSRPSRVIGMHFMNPVPLMKLVEIVRGLQTSDETHEVVRGLALKLGKTVICSKDVPGFLVNRILIPLLNEAIFALEQGVGTAEDIDTGAKLGLNHPMGPLELADLIGLDTVLSIAEILHREFGDSKYRPSTLLRTMVSAGYLGRKTGRGFYLYSKN